MLRSARHPRCPSRRRRLWTWKRQTRQARPPRRRRLLAGAPHLILFNASGDAVTRGTRRRTSWMIGAMATTQSTEDIILVLNRLVGESIVQLQVLGVNSLKSVAPSPADLVGRTITAVAVDDRSLTIEIGDLRAVIDLQRTGRLRWRDRAEPARIGSPGLPTLRLLLESGAGLDFSEPARTKRISVTISSA